LEPPQRSAHADALGVGGDPAAQMLRDCGGSVAENFSSQLREVARGVQPRGHRGGIYPFMRAAMCVVVRDLIVYGVLTDMMRGRPAVYSTFSSYDEVAHHSGPESEDALKKVRYGRIIIKPAEETPGVCVGLVRAFVDAGAPAGVINLVFGVPSEISEHLITSPIIRKVSFTGSVPVGWGIASKEASASR
jgi:hypothetical protein